MKFHRIGCLLVAAVLTGCCSPPKAPPDDEEQSSAQTSPNGTTWQLDQLREIQRAREKQGN